MKIQITVFSTTGKYRPMSTLVEVDNMLAYLRDAININRTAIKRICAQRGVDWAWMQEYGYTEVKARKYDPEKIAAEKAARYEAIKKERGWN